MQIVKKIFNKLSIFFFGALLAVGIPLVVVINQLSSSAEVKSWLSDGNVYQNIVSNFADIVPIDENGEKTLGQLIDETEGIDRSAFNDRIAEALPPEFLQSEFEPAIDSAVGFFFHGQELDFEISLADRKQQTKDALSAFFRDYINALPECQSIETIPDDVFNAACRPPDINVDQEIDSAVASFVDDNEIFNESLSEDDFSTKELSRLQEDTQRLTNIPVALLTLLALSGLLVMLTAKNIWLAIRQLGYSLLLNGALVAIIWGVVQSVIDPESLLENQMDGDEQSRGLIEIVAPVFDQVLASLGGGIIQIGILVALLGAALLGGYYWHKKHIHDKHHDGRTGGKKMPTDMKPDHPEKAS